MTPTEAAAVVKSIVAGKVLEPGRMFFVSRMSGEEGFQLHDVSQADACATMRDMGTPRYAEMVEAYPSDTRWIYFADVVTQQTGLLRGADGMVLS